MPLLDESKKDDAKPDEAEQTDDAAVLAAVKAALGERVADVTASSRLADSPACLVAAKSGPDLEIERLMSRQNRGVGAKPILELNMKHALVKAIGSAQKGERGRCERSLVAAVRAGANPRRRGAGRSGGLRGAAEPAGGAGIGRLTASGHQQAHRGIDLTRAGQHVGDRFGRRGRRNAPLARNSRQAGPLNQALQSRLVFGDRERIAILLLLEAPLVAAQAEHRHALRGDFPARERADERKGIDENVDRMGIDREIDIVVQERDSSRELGRVP